MNYRKIIFVSFILPRHKIDIDLTFSFDHICVKSLCHLYCLRKKIDRSRKKIDKNKFNDRKKLSVVFDRAMSNVYENNIFPTLPCDMVEIHNITS